MGGDGGLCVPYASMDTQSTQPAQPAQPAQPDQPDQPAQPTQSAQLKQKDNGEVAGTSTVEPTEQATQEPETEPEAEPVEPPPAPVSTPRGGGAATGTAPPPLGQPVAATTLLMHAKHSTLAIPSQTPTTRSGSSKGPDQITSTQKRAHTTGLVMQYFIFYTYVLHTHSLHFTVSMSADAHSPWSRRDP